MKVVLDTNVLLMSLPKTSRYRLIFDKLIDATYDLALSHDILQEYLEIIAQKTNFTIAKNVGNTIVSLKNLQKVEVYFKWHLITQDPDDNKFVDCAIAANVKYVVSNDKHFRILKNIDFPKVTVITIDEFLKELQEDKK